MIKKHWKKLLILIAIVVGVSLAAFGILFGTGVLQIKDGIIFNAELFDSLRGTPWVYIVFLLIQIVVTVLLAFAPGGSMTFIALGVVLFGPTWQCFLVCFGGVIISSILMDIIGRFGGAALVRRMVGESDYHKALDLIKTKKYTYLPFMYLLPVFPDDALCMVAGMSKINFWYHATIILLCRGIGVATIVFGINLIPYRTFTSFYDWFVLGGILIAYIFTLLKLANWIDKTMSKVVAKLEAKKQSKINTLEGSAGETFTSQPIEEKEKDNE